MSRSNPLRNPSLAHNAIDKPKAKKSSEEGTGTKSTTSTHKKTKP